MGGHPVQGKLGRLEKVMEQFHLPLVLTVYRQSGPLDLCGTTSESSCLTPSIEILKFVSLQEKCASTEGRQSVSSLVKTEVKYLFNSSAFLKLSVTT